MLGDMFSLREKPAPKSLDAVFFFAISLVADTLPGTRAGSVGCAVAAIPDIFCLCMSRSCAEAAFTAAGVAADGPPCESNAACSIASDVKSRAGREAVFDDVVAVSEASACRSTFGLWSCSGKTAELDNGVAAKQLEPAGESTASLSTLFDLPGRSGDGTEVKSRRPARDPAAACCKVSAPCRLKTFLADRATQDRTAAPQSTSKGTVRASTNHIHDIVRGMFAAVSDATSELLWLRDVSTK